MHLGTLVHKGFLMGQCHLSIVILCYFKKRKRFLWEKPTSNGPAFNKSPPQCTKAVVKGPWP